MTSSERKMYRSIPCQTEGDVFKCSVAFLRGSAAKKESVFSRDERYLRMEEHLRNKFFQDSEKGWEQKTMDQKIVLAICLTCEYLASCNRLAQEILGFRCAFFATTESTIQVPNGVRFPFLFPFCLALLEQDMGSSNINVAYESYGTKSRASETIANVEPINIMAAAQGLFEMNRFLSTGYIWRFAKLIKAQKYCSTSQLFIGYGCNFKDADETGRHQYATVDIKSIPNKFIKFIKRSIC